MNVLLWKLWCSCYFNPYRQSKSRLNVRMDGYVASEMPKFPLVARIPLRVPSAPCAGRYSSAFVTRYNSDVIYNIIYPQEDRYDGTWFYARENDVICVTAVAHWYCAGENAQNVNNSAESATNPRRHRA